MDKIMKKIEDKKTDKDENDAIKEEIKNDQK